MPEKRYLLCRPLGGLNDTLCQIDHCRRYAEQFGRILIVDGRYSGILGEFGDYFDMAGEGHILRTTSPEMPDIDAMDCLPTEVRGRVSSIKWSGYASPQGYVATDEITGAPLRFDRTCDHAAPLLIHEQAGGGVNSFDLLERLTIAPALAARIRAVFDSLPQPFLALHIRNTDYKTDLDMVLEFMRKRNVRRDLVLCTDNPDTFQRFRAELPKLKLHQVTKSPVAVSGPAHRTGRHAAAEIRREIAENSLIELCVLAGAVDLFVAPLHAVATSTGERSFAGEPVRLSGFSRLAIHLCRDKRRLRRLLGSAGDDLLPGYGFGRITVISPPEGQATA